jgi:GAF domain-containing protein/CheY-like chemotaxis protein
VSRAVLLIEDDPLFREAIKSLFEGEPYEFFDADSPAAGIEILRKTRDIRVVVLDLLFKGPEGTSALDFLASNATGYRVIVLTGHDELLTAERAETYQVFRYLAKAERSASQSIRFTVEAAFQYVERELLGEKTRFLLEVQERINANRPLKDTLDLICRRVLDIVGGYTCHIRLYDFRKGDFHLQGFAGAEEGMRAVFAQPRAKGELFSGEVVASGQPVWYDDLPSLAKFQEFSRRALEGRTSTPEESLYWRTVRSAYIVPISTLLYEHQVDAVLNISSDRMAFFDAGKRGAVDEFVTQATLAVSKEWLRIKRAEAHEDYGKISELLGEMSKELTNDSDLSGVLEVVTSKISELVHPELVSIFLFDEVGQVLTNVAELRGNERNPNPRETYLPGQSLTGSVFKDQKTIHLPLPGSGGGVGAPLDDARYDREDVEIDRKLLPSGDIRHYLGVPIIVDGNCRGVLRAVNKKSDYYDDRTLTSKGHCLLERGFSVDCRNVLEITASHLGAAIRNSELLRDKQRQVDQVRTLGEVGQLINSALDIAEVLRLTMKEMARVMQAEICMLFLKSGEDRVVLEQSLGMPKIDGAFYLLGEGVTGKVAQTGEPERQVAQAGKNKGKYDAEIQEFLTARHGAPTEIESLMVAPISAKGTILGALKVINKVGDHFQYTASDLEFFKTFADYVGIAIENAQTYKNLSLLVSCVAHEINNTSGVIPANVEGIRTQMGELDEDVEDMLSVIEEAASQATAFANEIAGFSAKGMEGKRPLDLNKLVRDTVAVINLSTGSDPESRAKLRLRLASESLDCEVYERPFAQIIRNIVINAIQALEGRNDGWLTISSAGVEKDGVGFARLRFEDNGPGIKPEHLSRIFEAEFTTKSKGNGVGLWLVRTQLQPVGGTIEVESELSKGAVFTVQVPLAENIRGTV